MFNKINEIISKVKEFDIIGKVKGLFKPKEENHPWYSLYDKNIPRTMEYPSCSMYELIEKTSIKYPYHIAYAYYGKKVNYTDLIRKIKAAAKGLKKLGVRKNDFVTICMPNTPEAVITFYAINMVGGIANMVHPLSSEKEIEFYLNKSKSKFMLCLDKVYPKVLKILDNTQVNTVIISKASGGMPLYMNILYNLTQKQTKIDYDERTISYHKMILLGKTYKKDYQVYRRAKDDAVVLYSGGTTGDPKGIVLTNNNLNACALQCFKMTDPAKVGDSVLTIMPIFHGFGIGVCVHTCLANGMFTILVPTFKAQELYKIIKKNKPSFLAGVPTMYEALINSKEKSKTYMKSVHTVICGGDTLLEPLRDRVDAYLKAHGSEAKIRVGYGLSECTAASCLTPRYYFKEGGIGIPFPDTIYKIVKPETKDKCEPNEVGEICISGPTVMNRYLDDSKETAKVLKRHSDGKLWLHTGDMGYMTEEGLVFFKARLKRLIVSSGYNIYPSYLEKIINTHPAVQTCTVVGIPHPYKQQVPKAFIILRDNFDETDDLKNDIKSYCEKHIAKYELPSEYEYVKELPKTLVGKVAFTKLMKNNKKGD